ncbi:undecaprenyl-diphosphatase [Neobacillus ginsengisoli]|uniref:Undecaprenyl-diphosphatase n=1 Tax=Neobacillus ginsengisoli TaxID=904295 RepID=A0ABT9XUV0_9BACI|nr:undecaprenyl-diphosphatase [Neobacillus ginsengisoli]MDQ0199035.1 undecaprenyl-diphosphatase [Neobacillus ginsengisoli]
MNYKLFQAINQNAGHHPFLDGLMVFVTQNALIVYAIVLLLMWFVGKEKYKYTVVFAAITGALGLFINLVIGHIYYEPRPFVTHKVHLLIQHAKDASFPSDHTTGAFSLALAVLLRHRKIGFGMLLFAILTGISRVYVGHHYPFDVLGSIVVGLLVSTIVYNARSLLQPIPRTIINIYNQIPLVPKNGQSLSK